ncbi:MAG TPA: AAA family ATPase [Gemmatimonadales bacterium]|jgi:DNA-binding SARP family transcriptional activator|nr:AAA family ATPase [Gemmatimonadales bacterium]
MIVCRVLGPVEVTVDGAAAPLELLWRKHLALLLYLARSPKRARTREHLTGLLWPDKEESAARHSLNEALRVVRKAAGDDAIDTTAGQVRLAVPAVQLDADELELRAEHGEWAAAAAMVAGEFLEGFALPENSAFEDWLAVERRHWTARSTRVLLEHSDALLREGRADEALTVAHRADGLDPDNELVARAVMGACAVLGDSAAALDHFARFAERRIREIGSGPGPEIRVLADRIRTARAGRPRPAVGKTDVADRRRAPLVGRGRELQRLLEHWERCRAGGGAVALLLVGDAGTGKSRLLEEFLARVRVAGGAASLVRAVEGDGEAPGGGLIGLARGGLLEAPGLPTASPEAIGMFAAQIPEWAERFPLAAAGSGQTITAAFGALLAASLTEGPVVLAVDDAHWIDRISLLGLLAGTRDHARAAFCLILSAGTYPPRAELDDFRRRLGNDVPGGVVALGPLDREALWALAAWALPGYDAVALERAVRRVGNDSAGLPLLAVELLSAVAHGLDLTQGPGTWPERFRTLSQTLPGDLPDSVVAAFRIGFRRLTHEAQQVLAAAAVMGDRNTEAVLARASGLEPAQVAAALDELEWQRWLEADARGYAFVARLAGLVVARDMVTAGQRDRYRARAGLPPVLPASSS